MNDIYAGVPQRFMANGIFGYKQEIIQVGDTVEAVSNVDGTIAAGTRCTIAEILIEPRSDIKGFTKRVVFQEIDGDFNPKRFRKISVESFPPVQSMAAGMG